jgi:pimeloyl-ACP methyl ester carboxylesterase
MVFAPDRLGYGRSPAPTSSYGIKEEVAHLTRLLDLHNVGTLHLVTHSLGSLIGLHLRRSLGARVTRMTLIDPIVVSVLRERGEDAAYAEMEEQYHRFMSLSEEAAAGFFVDHSSGAGASSPWESGRARSSWRSFRRCDWR